MATVYRKTRLGQSEIETRALRLLPRLRNMLIVVDGRRDHDALQDLLGYAPGPALKELMAYGLIEAVYQKSSSVALAGSDSMPAPLSSTLDEASFELLRKESVRALNEALGPTAESLAIRMERATGEAELRPLIERASSMISMVRGASEGRSFAEKFQPGSGAD